jgi:hypothetical protein
VFPFAARRALKKHLVGFEKHDARAEELFLESPHASLDRLLPVGTEVTGIPG